MSMKENKELKRLRELSGLKKVIKESPERIEAELKNSLLSANDSVVMHILSRNANDYILSNIADNFRLNKAIQNFIDRNASKLYATLLKSGSVPACIAPSMLSGYDILTPAEHYFPHLSTEELADEVYGILYNPNRMTNRFKGNVAGVIKSCLQGKEAEVAQTMYGWGDFEPSWNSQLSQFSPTLLSILKKKAGYSDQ